MKKIYAWLIDLGAAAYFWACLVFLIGRLIDFPGFMLPLIINSLALSGILALGSDSPGQRLMEIPKKKKKPSSLCNWFILILILITLWVGWIIIEVNVYDFFTGFTNARGIVSGLFSPNLKLLLPMLSALIETIYLALLATVFAIPFAFAFSFLAARNLMPNSFWGNLIYTIVRTMATFFRSVEAVVWAIVFCVWVGIGPFAGMLALMIHSIAALTKLYSEQIENINSGQLEAIKSTGATTLQVWLYAVIPQIISPYLAFTIYRWDINVRMATIVGFVGGGGIGLALQQEQQLLRWHNVGLIIWLIAIVIWIMDMVSGKIRAKLMEF